MLNKINSFFASAFALKGIEYDQVPVNLIKDGGQQVQHHKIYSLQTVEYRCKYILYLFNGFSPVS